MPMASVTIHVVQAFEQRGDGVMAAEPKSCPSAGAARALAARLALTHAGVIAWSRTGEPELGDWGPAGGPVSELRIDYGPGYRLYFTRRGKILVILLAGGDKSTQKRDIKRAQGREQHEGTPAARFEYG